MSKAEKTKQFIIEKSSVHFNKKGYLGTSLSEITDITGLTKGSIYGNFENKDDLAQAAYKFNAKKIGARLLQVSEQCTGGADEKLTAILDYYRNNWRELMQHGGCPLLNAAVEVDDTFPKLIPYVRKSFNEFSKMLESIIFLGITEKRFRPEIESEKFAATIIMLIEGGILLSQTLDNKDYLNIALDRVEFIIQNEMLV
ncbi:TetR family transcriptional regulator [Ulvibacter sp. MAR_2010_11]|uniref:TetR/AcrR family transcriptional regulator n=1 Tax=Ulvibacter sp. MAR_2010_11 TaxID=1250229 RepID=UPI000C2CA3D3|nr:TetR/AcrR family transcriptional regulator [Ulvibacter sp. MAR_2010_11]PKA83134.1 TetR family transcriptional regulator [Ulvibacter sp. MAR_2010_11]